MAFENPICQNVVCRQIDVSKKPAVVTVATIHGGTRKNINPDQVEMGGTIRSIAEADRARTEVKIEKAVPVTVNDPALTEKMLPTLKRMGGESGSKVNQRVMVAEDFSYFQQQVPGMFCFVGITPKDQDMAQAASKHSPRFYIDESGLLAGARCLAALAVDFLSQ